MVRTAQNQTEAYEAKYLSAQYQSALTLVETLAAQDYASFANDWVVKRDLTVGELNTNGIFPICWGGYLAYSSLLWRLSQVVAGLALQEAAAVYEAEWTARGLTAAVLADIRVNVYNIAAPPGP